MSLKPPTEGTPSTTSVNNAALNSRLTVVENSSVAVSPKAYGGDSTGATASDTAIATALATGRPVDLGGPENTWKITAAITPSSGAKLIGRGAIVDFSAQTGTFTALNVVGTMGTPANLTGNATAGDLTLTAPSAGFADDDYVLVGSTAVTGTTNVPKGEIGRLQTASSMTLLDPIDDSYATADTAFVAKLSPVEEIVISGIHFRGPTDNTLDIFGINIDRARDVTITDCIFERTHRAAITITDATGVRVRGCHFHDIRKTGLAYGIVLQNATQDVSIATCTGHRLRHMVTHGGLTSRNGMPRRTVTMGCVASQSIEGAFDCHPGGSDISFIGNTCYGSDQDGIIHQGRSGVIADNTIIRPFRHGILIQPLTVLSGEFVVSGNRVRNAGSQGIFVTTAAGSGAPTAMTVTGNTINGCLIGINMTCSANAGTYYTVTSNAIRGAASHGIQLDTVTGGTCQGNTVETVVASVVGIYLRGWIDGTATGNVVRATNATSTVGIRVGAGATAVASNDATVLANRVTGAATGILLDSTSTNIAVVGNDATGCTTRYSLSTGAGNIAANNIGGVVATVASASTITLPASESGIYKISGSTTIDTITAFVGRITLIFTATAGLSDSVGNIKLAAGVTGTADDAVDLVGDGTSWFQTGPASAN